MSPLKLSTLSLIFLSYLTLTLSSNPHKILFKSPNLYPESFVYDSSAQHFLVSSLRHRTISSVSDAAVTETLIHDHSLPPDASILGLAVDSRRRRLLAVIHSDPPLPQFDALAAYDLTTSQRIFLSNLPFEDSDPRPVANDVAVDFDGNAYVTNSAGNYIWKVDVNGQPSIFSRSKMFKKFPSTVDSEYGLNGVVYVSKGYLLVVQTSTGQLFKVDVEDGTARQVLLTEGLVMPDGIAMRRDGVVLVVSKSKLWFLKSDDSWSQGVVFDKTDLDVERFAGAVTVRDERAYVLYGHVGEGIMGNGDRKVFGIEEVRSEKESKDENVWIYILIGVGLAYFLFWRFQMKRLISNMDKKIS